MAWIESHQKLKDDPKMLELCFKMGWSVDETIGKLHRFWWWCVDHAEDGDLRRFNDGHIAHAMCVDVARAKELVEIMVTCGKPKGFIEREPYFRVPNWWKYMQKFLHSKYGKSNPDRVEFIRKLYHSGEHSGNPANLPTYRPTDLLGEIEKPEKYKKIHPSAKDVLYFLNKTTESHYRGIDGNLEIITARLNEDGVTIEGVKKMILRQTGMWTGTDMEKFLRPETLFKKSKFDGYYAQRDKEVFKRNEISRTNSNAGTINAKTKSTYNVTERLRKP